MKRLSVIILILSACACHSASLKIPAIVDNRGRVPSSVRRKSSKDILERWEVDYNRFGNILIRVKIDAYENEKDSREVLEKRIKPFRLTALKFDGADGKAGGYTNRPGRNQYLRVITRRHRFIVDFTALKGHVSRAFVEDFLAQAIIVR